MSSKAALQLSHENRQNVGTTTQSKMFLIVQYSLLRHAPLQIEMAHNGTAM
jgi:hypothetical protein